MKNCNEEDKRQGDGEVSVVGIGGERFRTGPRVWTHEEEKTLVFADGSAAAQEAQQEQHASHPQDDVDAGEEQRVGRDDFPEARGIHQHPHAHSQQEGAPQLVEKQDKSAV